MNELNGLWSGEGSAVARLQARDETLWCLLFEHTFMPDVPPPPVSLVSAMIRHEPSWDAWLGHASAAAVGCRSPRFTTARGAVRLWERWLATAFVANTTDPLELSKHRFAAVLKRAGDADEGDPPLHPELRAIVDEARALGADAAAIAAMLLRVHAVATDEHCHDAALAAVVEAEALLERGGNHASMDYARRLHAGVLLRLDRIDEAFVLLDPLLASLGPAFGGEFSSSSLGSSDRTPRMEALYEAATVAAWAQATTPEWLRALGGLAERTGDAVLLARFDSGMREMLRTSRNPGGDLEVVIRHAAQRDSRATAARAEAIGAELGVKPEASSAPELWSTVVELVDLYSSSAEVAVVVVTTTLRAGRHALGRNRNARAQRTQDEQGGGSTTVGGTSTGKSRSSWSASACPTVVVTLEPLRLRVVGHDWTSLSAACAASPYALIWLYVPGTLSCAIMGVARSSALRTRSWMRRRHVASASSPWPSAFPMLPVSEFIAERMSATRAFARTRFSSKESFVSLR